MKAAWFPEARFGMFIHWGLYSIPGGIWQGREMEYIGEWLQSRFRIPNREYETLASRFNPERFDADAWCRTARDAGMRYLVFSAKHHDGFAMFHSRVDSYNVVDATPFGRDPLQELAASCRKFGLKLGIYYSQDLDWHHPDGGDPGPDAPKNHGMSWGNDWDFPEYPVKNFRRYLDGKVIPQLKELLTGYGEISIFWFDCPLTISRSESEEIVALIRSRRVSSTPGSAMASAITAVSATTSCPTPAGMVCGRRREHSIAPGDSNGTITTGRVRTMFCLCWLLWRRRTPTIC